MTTSREHEEISIYGTLLQHGSWTVPIGATADGLCCIGANGESLEDLMMRESSRFNVSQWVQDDSKLELYKEQITQYWDGKRESFTFKRDTGGTAFQNAVWEALLAIPYGVTVSYSDIAQAIDKPKAVRAVGSAIGANPLLIMVPCHRVVGKNGALTGYRGGLAMKTKLLELEDANRTGV
ncbi:methylated-DNA--[protein]-cysteine S-methyltransferase [Paenibacillus paeoniae]|uniref:methylated-DNA--[protein]-cysteine S-methyltransferase n=1 Tax=Paenibacillus paeoniae TaxID=2292705 RepID=A0A371P6R2_9BACL|nr:methylated-DNA--[protein]-cysteine S-methyltransferase [Paenibacillus paeoniae]REK71644.1 methylated-DNA--[protein]-cysteine S-methyltransferase [Paenibacillus paeoniae]